MFQIFLQDLRILDLGFGFLVKSCVYSWLEMSGNHQFGQQITKSSFETVCFKLDQRFPRIWRNLGEILPTSLPELPIHPRDLRNKQESLSKPSYYSSTTNRQLDCWTCISVSRPLELVLGRKIHVDSESEVQTSHF